jgi:hypothetical protein
MDDGMSPDDHLCSKITFPRAEGNFSVEVDELPVPLEPSHPPADL